MIKLGNLFHVGQKALKAANIAGKHPNVEKTVKTVTTPTIDGNLAKIDDIIKELSEKRAAMTNHYSLSKLV